MTISRGNKKLSFANQRVMGEIMAQINRVAQLYHDNFLFATQEIQTGVVPQHHREVYEKASKDNKKHKNNAVKK